MSAARCPRCESSALEPCDVLIEASDRSEDIVATHPCLNPKCREAFRYTPPMKETACPSPAA